MERSRQPTNPFIRRAPEAAGGAEPADEEAARGRRSELREWLSEASHRIEEVVDAAERVADAIRADAQREADAYLEERKREADHLAEDRLRALEGIGAPLLERAEGLREALSAASIELDRAIKRIVALNDGPQPMPTAEAAEPLVKPARDEAPEVQASAPVRAAPHPAVHPGEAKEAEAQGSDAGAAAAGAMQAQAILRATQLAVSGRDKAGIEATLRDEFDLADPAAVVDSILGPD
jgi:hypothetical protein